MKFPSNQDKNGFVKAIDKNWKYGLCKHKVAFEATETIKKFRFHGDLMAFGMVDGHVCIIRMSTGDILDRYLQHESEVRAVDFDGTNLVSGRVHMTRTAFPFRSAMFGLKSY
jgi:hypothetical protein